MFVVNERKKIAIFSRLSTFLRRHKFEFSLSAVVIKRLHSFLRRISNHRSPSPSRLVAPPPTEDAAGGFPPSHIYILKKGRTCSVLSPAFYGHLTDSIQLITIENIFTCRRCEDTRTSESCSALWLFTTTCGEKTQPLRG